jgi:multisubunit Na+/H+ antiporter MnhG subunit
MSVLPADLGIWALLCIGTVFCGFGLMGLLIFPDTKSRMFTAFRATLIGLGAVTLAVLLYAFSMILTNGGDQYLALVLHTLFLVVVPAAGTWVMYGIIRERIRQEKPASACQPPAVSEPGTKDGE